MGRILYFMFLFVSSLGWITAWGQPSMDEPLTVSCTQSLKENYAIPNGALWKKEKIRQETPPSGFTTVVGWINATTVRSCADKTALIEIRRIRVIQSSDQRIVQDVSPAVNRTGFEGKLFSRTPKWFQGKESTQSIDSVQGDALVIDLNQASRMVYHGWTAPRTPVVPGSKYIVEIEARITGDARLQLGIDYWKGSASPYNGYDDNCSGTNNCEGWISKWYGDTHGQFMTFRAPQGL